MPKLSKIKPIEAPEEDIKIDPKDLVGAEDDFDTGGVIRHKKHTGESSQYRKVDESKYKRKRF